MDMLGVTAVIHFQGVRLPGNLLPIPPTKLFHECYEVRSGMA